MEEVSLNLIPDNEVKYIYYSLLHNKYEKKQINKLFKYFSLSIEYVDDANKLLSKEAIKNNSLFNIYIIYLTLKLLLIFFF